MLNNAQEFFTRAPWLAIFPGVAIIAPLFIQFSTFGVIDTALVHQSPTIPVIGSLPAVDGMARIATRPFPSRCALTTRYVAVRDSL